MIIRRYSEKDAPMDVQYKKYLTSLARMIDPKDPIYFEFKNGKVFVEQRLYASIEPKIELDRKLRYIYNKHILMWQPELSVDENKIKKEFRNFLSGFITDILLTFSTRHYSLPTIYSISMNTAYFLMVLSLER